MQSTYLTSAKKPQQIPYFTAPVVAVVGRSNCGKSSLLNALMARKSLVRTSSTPGRTAAINFFDFNSEWVYADLPGYGYSATGKSEAAQWDRLAKGFFSLGKVDYVLYLTDIRREFDYDEIAYLAELMQNVPVAVCLTKADKLKRRQIDNFRQTQIREITIKLGQQPQIFAVSALKKSGVDALRDHLRNNLLH